MRRSVLAVIPARYASSRFPGKPLKPILGRPMLAWVVEGLKQSQVVTDICVATDHPEIFTLAESLGVSAVMTPADLPSGTDRVFAAYNCLVEKRPDKQSWQVSPPLVVNIQGDEPLLEGWMVDDLVAPLLTENPPDMTTLARKLKPEDLESDATAKIVLNQRSEAIYFSRFPIPFSKVKAWSLAGACVKHIGLYAFQPEFLMRFCQHPPAQIEIAESLEQLRALYLGARIGVVVVDNESWGVDRPEDIFLVEKLLSERKRK